MSERITREQYDEALKIVRAYEKQCEDDKLAPYQDCTEEDIVKNETTNNLSGNKEYHFWVTKGSDYPNRNSDGCITYDYNCNFYTLERGRIPYNTFEQAYKSMIKSFKRKGYIK